MGKKSTPPAPDYAAAAEKQGEASKDLTTAQTWANRPTLSTPWGSQSWQAYQGVDPGTGDPVTKWTSDIKLSPQQQAALDSQMRVQTGRSMGAEAMLQNALSGFGVTLDPSSYSVSSSTQSGTRPAGGKSPSGGKNPPSPATPNTGTTSRVGSAAPIDYSGITAEGSEVTAPQYQTSFADVGGPQRSLGDAGAIQRQLANTAGGWRQAGQDAALAFQQPLHEQQQAALETRLANMGLTRGSEAWKNEMRNQQDQFTRNNLQAFQSGQNEANLLFGMDTARGQFANQAQQQAYNQMMGSGQFANQAQQQAYNQAQGRGQFANAAMGQQLQGDINASGYNQTLRQQQIAEMLQKRIQPLNELNALLTGQQVASPQMPNFSTASKAETPQYLNAANMQYDAALDAFNAKQAGIGGTMSGLFGLGSAALGNPLGLSGLFKF